jgi:hypothetical protein
MTRVRTLDIRNVSDAIAGRLERLASREGARASS